METAKPISACNGGVKIADSTECPNIVNSSTGPGTLEHIRETCLFNENVENLPMNSGKNPIILQYINEKTCPCDSSFNLFMRIFVFSNLLRGSETDTGKFNNNPPD